MAEDCIFCSIVKDEAEAYKVYEDENVLAFLDANPVSKGHTLVIPKKHVENIHEASEMDFMWEGIKKVADGVKEAFDAHGINITQNNGENAGQAVFHLHFHVTPIYTGNEIDLEYNTSDLENGDKISKTLADKIEKNS